MMRSARWGLSLTCLLLGAAVAQADAPDPVAAPATAPMPAGTPDPKPVSAAEFAGLEHFAAANDKLPAPARDEKRIVFLGDSITEGWRDADPAFFARPARINRGIGGQTTAQMLLRFRQDVVALRPAVVHILAGINDIAGNTGVYDLAVTQANFASMVDLARANGIRVVLGSVLPAKDFRWRRGLDPGPKVVALNGWLRSYARVEQLVFVDYYAAMNDGALGLREALGKDGVHPSKVGYEVMDPLADAGIAAALGPARRR